MENGFIKNTLTKIAKKYLNNLNKPAENYENNGNNYKYIIKLQ